MIMLLHENAHQYTSIANLTRATLATRGWEIMRHSPYSPDLAHSDFHLFGPMKVNLGGQNSKTDDELKCGDMNWLCNQDKTFYAPAINNLRGRWGK
jgi:histone-lysine N-methyltransferase SETMAR